MTTAELRRAVKAVDPEARVAKVDDDHWTIRTYAEADAVMRLLPSLGLTLWPELTDFEGSRWDATTVLHVVKLDELAREEHATSKAKKKSPQQLDAEIAHALKKSSASGLASEPDEWKEIDDEYAGAVQSLIDDGYTRDEARASAEDNIRETYDDEVLLWRPKHERRAREARRKA